MLLQSSKGVDIHLNDFEISLIWFFTARISVRKICLLVCVSENELRIHKITLMKKLGVGNICQMRLWFVKNMPYEKLSKKNSDFFDYSEIVVKSLKVESSMGCMK